MRKVKFATLLIFIGVLLHTDGIPSLWGADAKDGEPELIVQVNIAEQDHRVRPMEMLIGLQNNTSTRVSYIGHTKYDIFTIAISDSKGRKVAFADFGEQYLSPTAPSQLFGGGPTMLVEPGKLRMWHLDLSKCFHLPDGEYEAKVKMRGQKHDGEKRVDAIIESAPVRFISSP